MSGEPLPKASFMMLYGFDPTLNRECFTRFEFFEKFGYDPTVPRKLVTDESKTSSIIVVDEQSLYYQL